MGEQRPALPVFPAAMSTLNQPTTGPPRWLPTRVAAAVLCFAAVVLVIAGSFLPLYSTELSFVGENIEVTVTPWSSDVAWGGDMAGAPDTGEAPKVGYPLVFAAIVLACAAALCWYAATPDASPGAGRVAGLTTATGGAFLIGTVWSVALLVVNSVDSILLLGSLAGGFETDGTYLVGHWLLLTAAALGLVAAMLSLVPVRRPTWQQVPQPDPNLPTPPYGIGLPVVASYQASQYAVDPLTGHPLRVDPLTGRPYPAGPPSGVPAAGLPFPQSPPGGQPVPFTQEPVGPVNGAAVGPPTAVPEAARAQEAPPEPAVPPADPPRS